MAVAPIYKMGYRDGSVHTSQSPMEEMEDSVEPGIRVTKETEKWFLYLIYIFQVCSMYCVLLKRWYVFILLNGGRMVMTQLMEW